MTPSEWATTAIVVALWLAAGIPLAWRTVRAMRHRTDMKSELRLQLFRRQEIDAERRSDRELMDRAEEGDRIRLAHVLVHMPGEDGPLPPRLHKCADAAASLLAKRCACGAISQHGGRPYWMEKNSFRDHWEKRLEAADEKAGI